MDKSEGEEWEGETDELLNFPLTSTRIVILHAQHGKEVGQEHVG
jgi:hypothetical protein